MFRDRKDGGEQLANALEQYRDQNVLVLGIPRGGVETAFYVATHLHADFSFVVTRKLGYPFHQEAAFGALAEDGSYFIFKEANLTLSPEVIQSVVEKEQQEITRRVNVLRKGEPLPSMKGRTIVLVDDGIATGATLFATIDLCKKQNPKKIIVAAPVAGNRMEKMLQEKVDDVVILYTPPFFSAVSQAYHAFDNLTDKEVLDFMRQWEMEEA